MKVVGRCLQMFWGLCFLTPTAQQSQAGGNKHQEILAHLCALMFCHHSVLNNVVTPLRWLQSYCQLFSVQDIIEASLVQV